MKDDAPSVRDLAPQHARYWREAEPARRGGPFSDRSGGLIIFASLNEETAAATVAEDPFQRYGLLERWWLKAWEPETAPPRS